MQVHVRPLGLARRARVAPPEPHLSGDQGSHQTSAVGYITMRRLLQVSAGSRPVFFSPSKDQRQPMARHRWAGGEQGLVEELC